ncbi:MAG: hypothetical protein HOP29_19835 [Phycisphaerales bacterium]|nr:hypothetical protein [Phycisphaerales bacterium]
MSGAGEEIERLRGVIAKLDQEVEDAGNKPRIIALEHARAAQIEPVLTKMFVESRRSGGSGASTVQAPVVAADEISNTLIVRAGAADMSQIENLVKELDVPSSEDRAGHLIIPVAEGVNVMDLASLVETTINQSEQIRAQAVPGMEPGTILITPDVRTNALVLGGTPTLFADAEKLIKSLETMGPTGRLSMRTIQLNNMKPDEARRLLERVIEENQQGQSAGSGRRGSGSGSRPAATRTPPRQPTRQPARPPVQRPRPAPTRGRG